LFPCLFHATRFDPNFLFGISDGYKFGFLTDILLEVLIFTLSFTFSTYYCDTHY